MEMYVGHRWRVQRDGRDVASWTVAATKALLESCRWFLYVGKIISTLARKRKHTRNKQKDTRATRRQILAVKNDIFSLFQWVLLVSLPGESGARAY